MPHTPAHPMASPHELGAPRQPITAGATSPAGAVIRPARLKLWPLDAGRYGLDATFDGNWGCEDAEQHAARLARWGLASAIRSEADGGWTLRLGPLSSLEVARALAYLQPAPG